MDNVKSVLTSALNWAKANPWRAAGILAIVSIWVMFMILPIWTFLKIVAVLLFIGAIISIALLLKSKDDDEEVTTRQSVLAWAILILFFFSIFLFFHANSYNPDVQAERAKSAKAESDKKKKEDADKKKKSASVNKIISVTNDKLQESLSSWSEDYAKGNEKSAWTAFVSKITADKDLAGIKISLTSDANLLSPAELYTVATEAHAMSKRTINGVAHSDNKDFAADDVYDFFGFSNDKDAAYSNPHAWLYRQDGTEIVHTSVMSNVFERDSFK